jgi:type II secretory pathway predicted ATPase ExeA
MIHEEALARLHFLVENQRRVGLLLGETGSGKSMLLNVFAHQLQKTGHSVTLLNLTGCNTADEFSQMLADAMGIGPRSDFSSFTLWRAVTDRLTERRYQQEHTVFLLDDTHLADASVLNHAVRLTQFCSLHNIGLTLVASTNTAQRHCLGPRLTELSELQIEVESWGESDTFGYLQQLLSQAGATGEVFNDAAVRQLHNLTHGIPRHVSRLANLSLLVGLGQQLGQIDKKTVLAAHQELAMAGG